MEVVLDDREDLRLRDAFRRMEGLELRVGRLGVGDFLVPGRLVAERKTIADLVASIVDDRLFLQADRMVQWAAAHSVVPVMVIEGTSRDLSSSMRREAVQGAIVTLGVILRIAILRSRDVTETVKVLTYASRQANASASQLAYPRGQRPRGKRKQQLNILQSLPGIGPKKAEALLNHFGTVAKVIQAPESDLSKLPTIGPDTAKKIRNVLNDPEAPYTIKNRREATS